MNGSGFIVNKPSLGRILTNSKFTIDSGQVVKISSTNVLDREILIVRNIGQNEVYIGGENVTIDTGFPVYPNEVVVLPIKSDLFAVANASTELRVLEG